jgi:uncharacterized protein
MPIINTNKALGLTLPLQRGPNGFFRQAYSLKEQVRSNLTNLIMTRKGERVMQPEFGCGIQEYLFEPLTDTTLSSIRGTIEESIQFWIPYVRIESLEVVRDEQTEHQVTVTLTYSIQNLLNSLDVVTFVFAG